MSKRGKDDTRWNRRDKKKKKKNSHIMHGKSMKRHETEREAKFLLELARIDKETEANEFE